MSLIPTVDWASIEGKFNELATFLHSPNLGASTAQQRAKQKENIELGMEAIVDVALSETNRLFTEGKINEAMFGGMRSLNMAQELYGLGAVQLIDVYFVLAKINQKMKNFVQAKEFLSQAYWTILKSDNDKSSTELRAELHQNFGTLYVSMESYSDALEHISQSIFYLASLHGTESLVTSVGYFSLGNVFATMNRLEVAVDIMGKVCDIWYQHLLVDLKSDILRTRSRSGSRSESRTSGAGSSLSMARGEDAVIDDNDRTIPLSTALSDRGSRARKPTVDPQLRDLDGVKPFEALKMFHEMVNVVTEKHGSGHIETAKVYLVLGLLYRRTKDLNEEHIHNARVNLIRAKQGFESTFGEKHPTTSIIAEIIDHHL